MKKCFARLRLAFLLLPPVDSITLDPIRLWVQRYFIALRLDRKAASSFFKFFSLAFKRQLFGF